MSVKKIHTAIIVLCLLSTALFVSCQFANSTDAASSTDAAGDGIVQREVYASDFVFSDENNTDYATKWEVCDDDSFADITCTSSEHSFAYSYPYSNGTFYVKESISSSLDFEESQTKVQIYEIVVLGPAPVITFDSQGGSYVSAISLPYYVGEQLPSATEPTAPTRSGYAFSGWYCDKACTQKFDFNTSVNENLTLYAGWTVKSVASSGNFNLLTGISEYLVVLLLILIVLLILVVFLFRRWRNKM